MTIDPPPIVWSVSDHPVAYEAAVAAMEARVAAIRAGTAGEVVWLLEHPAIYTAGTSARMSDLLDPGRFPVHRTGRGGQFTYHGPGQRVAYVMLDLKRRGRDVRAYVAGLERWLIGTLAALGVQAGRREGRVGVWVSRPELGAGRDDKIAAIGVRVRRWVSYHGIALNVAPELSHFDGIVACGIRGHGVTSLADLGVGISMSEADPVLRTTFEAIFGKTVDATGNDQFPAGGASSPGVVSK